MKRILFLAICAMLLTFTTSLQAHPRRGGRGSHNGCCMHQGNRCGNHRMIKRMIIRRMMMGRMMRHHHRGHRGWGR